MMPSVRKIGHGLGQVIARRLAGKLDLADGKGKEAEDTGNGQQPQQAKDQGLGPFVGDETECNRSPDQKPGDHEQQPDPARPVGMVKYGGRWRFDHGQAGEQVSDGRGLAPHALVHRQLGLICS